MIIPDWLNVIEEGRNPLSCRCFIIKGKEKTWVFDAGASDDAFNEIAGIGGRKSIILSHFHQDHISNICRIDADEIYQGSFTFRHTGAGTVISESTVIEDGISLRIFPLPNTHAKGSLALEVNGYAFLGDAAYPARNGGQAVYNATLLCDEIKALEDCRAQYFVMSHGDDFIKTKEDVMNRLYAVYEKRNPREAFIAV